NQELIAIGDNWNELLRNHEYKTLSGLFNCPETVLYPVKQIKPQEIQKIFTPTNPNGFYVNVMVTDINVLDSLQAAIVNGYENAPYIRERVDIKKANLTELISKTESELQKLDSTKQLMDDIIRGRGRMNSS